MEQYRIIIGSSQPAVFWEWETWLSWIAKRREKNTEKIPNGKDLYELARKFQNLLSKAFVHGSSSINGPLRRELKGGSKRRTRRHRKSRKSRKNRK